MKYKINILAVVIMVSLFGCTKDWDEHYKTRPETVNENVWDAIQKETDLSVFVGLVKEFKFDTLFNSDNSYTIFAPTNDAMAAFLSADNMTETILNYHFTEMYIQPNAISGKSKILTLGEKFALLENVGKATLLDGIQTMSESALYLNGKFFKIGSVVLPKPNIYEYIAETNPVLKRFIDDQDTVMLDLTLSRPLGYDEEGNTIYDSVTETINIFEEMYFPIKHELRSYSATFVYPSKDAYNDALNVVADVLGSRYNDYSDIPYQWQKEILIPMLLDKGVFMNMIEENEFLPLYDGDTVKLKNILGDSVVIDYEISEKTLCSNGYAYSYENFVIPDSLYNGATTFEAEWLLVPSGTSKYNWEDSVKVTSDVSFPPLKEFNSTASNDSLIRVNFSKKYSGKFILEFETDYLFPRKYLMSVRTHMDYGGIYNIYVNDVLVKTFDYSYYVSSKGIYTSVTGKRYTPTGRYNIFDCYVESISDYQKAKIRIEYKGPGSSTPNNGLVIDYIKFTPV